MQCFERGILGLHGIDMGDRIGSAERCGGALRETDVFGFAGFADLIQGRDGLFERCAGIDAMKIVEIGCETESLDSPFDVFLDVGSRVGDADSLGKASEPAFRGKEDLVTNIVFPDEVSQQFLVDASLVHNLAKRRQYLLVL